MTISAFSYIRNGIQFDYPFLQSLQSVLPIVDEFVMVVGDSTDGTREAIKALNSSKIIIVDSVWDMNGHVAGSRDRQTYRGHAAPEARTGAAAAGRAGPAPERTARAGNPDETRFERPGSAASANRMLDRQGVGGAEARAHADRGARSRTATDVAGPDRGLRRN